MSRMLRRQNLVLNDVEEFRMEAGKGVYARVSGRHLFCGNERYLIENGIDIPGQVADILDALHNQGKASILVAVDGICAGVIGLSDVLRVTAKRWSLSCMTWVHKLYCLPVITARTADYFAKQVGITTVRAESLPEKGAEHNPIATDG